MERKDFNIECVGCGRLFVFMATEQDFFEKKGFGNPKRCHQCRRLKREMNQANGRPANESVGSKSLKEAMERAGVPIKHNSKIL